jgi:hypothetical protein
MIKTQKTSVRRSKRTDLTLHLRQRYEGDVHADPRTYNRAYAEALRKMADAIEKVDDAWADPQVVLWIHVPGEITAEVTLSPEE